MQRRRLREGGGVLGAPEPLRIQGPGGPLGGPWEALHPHPHPMPWGLRGHRPPWNLDSLRGLCIYETHLNDGFCDGHTCLLTGQVSFPQLETGWSALLHASPKNIWPGPSEDHGRALLFQSQDPLKTSDYRQTKTRCIFGTHSQVNHIFASSLHLMIICM